jgi:uncharacterized protein with HEPN domain
MRSDRDRLSDMIEAIRLINEKLPRTKDEFAGSDLLQIWVLYHIQIIGEAANGISLPFRSSHPFSSLAGYYRYASSPYPPVLWYRS